MKSPADQILEALAKKGINKAQAQTVSLFTGQTDVDDPMAARDGSVPSPKKNKAARTAEQKAMLDEQVKTVNERMAAEARERSARGKLYAETCGQGELFVDWLKRMGAYCEPMPEWGEDDEAFDAVERECLET